MSELLILVLLAIGLGLVNAGWVLAFIREETSGMVPHLSLEEAAAFPA